MPGQDDIARDLETCIRDGQRLAQRLDEEEQRTEALEAALGALVARELTYGTDTGLYCVACDAEQLNFVKPFVHEPDCPWLTAKALLQRANDG